MHEDLQDDQCTVECEECANTIAFRPALREEKNEGDVAAQPLDADGSCRFFFVDTDRLLKYEGKTLPHHQQLLRAHPGMLVERAVRFEEACSGKLIEEACTVSHRWMSAHEPDEDGTQLTAIKAHLKANPKIKWLWYDAWCLPQGERTASELASFKRMLREVNMLYLGTSVLILLDLSYQSRFWVRIRLNLTRRPAAACLPC